MRKTMKVLALAAFVVFVMSATMVSAKDAKIKVNGKCGMCKAKIEKAAKGVKGVKSASWDQKTKVLTLDYNEKLTNVKAIETAIAKIGYDAGDVKADAEDVLNYQLVAKKMPQNLNAMAITTIIARSRF